MNQNPWEINPELTKERIVTVASIIANIRGEVIDRHDEELGDTPLSLGTRAYECSRSRIISVADMKILPWLKVITPEGRFTFSIGNTPVRFSRNDPKCLPDRKMIRSPEAARQLTLFENHTYADLRWFIVFDTFYKTAADNVYCVAYDKYKRIVCQWDIPLDGTVPMMSDMNVPLPQAIDVEEANVTLKIKPMLKVVKDGK
ncbi:MAG: hypothetical protein WBB23_18515 [Desulforhopalus sp.]